MAYVYNCVPHTQDESGSTFLCILDCCLHPVTFHLCVARIKKFIFMLIFILMLFNDDLIAVLAGAGIRE